jgi:choline dehydrogenase-like flavoprotein
MAESNALEGRYDYIVVGSGAGGAPLAARLAERGKRVLVLEAGPRLADRPAHDPAAEVSAVAGLSAASTEHPDFSWRFLVDHYQRDADGRLPDGIAEDPKEYKKDLPPGDPRRGIFYPRASALGGCTVHNAMITIAGPDADWDELAEFLRDESWSGNRMRNYFQRLECNGYLPRPAEQSESRTTRRGSTLWNTLAWIASPLAWLFPFLFPPRPDPTGGKHGFDGWLHTNVADLSVGLGDKRFKKMLKAALLESRAAGLDRAWTWVRTFLRGTAKEELDPNHFATQSRSPEGVVLIPAAVYGRGTTKDFNKSEPFIEPGARSSPRDLLLKTQARHSDRLDIWTDCLVTEVVLDGSEPPRAVGVKFVRGERLYRAHTNPDAAEGLDSFKQREEEVYVTVGGEVVLCGGTFNTPQLLMLSGIGDRAELEGFGIKCRVDRQGVGKNLQDRYEVSLVAEAPADFPVLKGATFNVPVPGGEPDPLLRRWREDGAGLYGSNGPALGIFKRSRPELAQPDLFIFGVPIEFRGYEVGYSVVRHHNRFTWVILKSHTRNSDGWVRLRSVDPRDPPRVNFNSFNTASSPGQSADDADVTALLRGVEFVRGILRRASFATEIHPGHNLVPKDNEQRTRDWIRRDAWGHHACGTCRMGPDEDPAANSAGRTTDPDAVLDSRFRVRGVKGLRVVDASIFPSIPGYFIVTNIYMASEKAADVLLEDSLVADSDQDPIHYPRELYRLERDAVEERRRHLNARVETLPQQTECPATQHPSLQDGDDPPAPDDNDGPAAMPAAAVAHDSASDAARSFWPDDATGLALSGGGIRSATTCLGVLQAMARARLLRKIDFLSTVSGGGYIGSCIGRLYDRLRPGDKSTRAPVARGLAADRVEGELIDPHSPVVDWLRKHGNYIAPQGTGDGRLNAAVFWRNLISVHLVIGLAAFALFGAAEAVRHGLFAPVEVALGLVIQPEEMPIAGLVESWIGPFLSPWFTIAELLLLFLVLPRMIGYWVVSQEEPQAFKPVSLVLLFAVAGGLLWIGIASGFQFEPLLLALAVLSALVHIELAWKRGAEQERAMGSGDQSSQRQRTRNILTYDLGLALAMTVMVLGFAAVDAIAHAIHEWKVAGNATYARAFSALGASVAAGLSLARGLAWLFPEKKSHSPAAISTSLKRDAVAGLTAILLMGLPLVFYSFTAHALFEATAFWIGVTATIAAGVVTLLLALPSARVFVNRSSLSQTYAARLARAYLGASNSLRFRPEGRDVTEVIPGDDVASIVEYRPHEASGPLHLINVTVNQTIDRASQLAKRDRKGENMAVSCLAVSVGERWHARWESPRRKEAAPMLRPVGECFGEHPFVDLLRRPPRRPEALSLRQWMGISGAAIDAGRGRTTRVGTALLMGLANLRTGYWWDSGLWDHDREGYPRLTPIRRLLAVLPRLFVTQSLLLSEWIARYPGPWKQFWHLADGGFFENTAAYELIRRRVPRLIVCDGGADPQYEYEDFGELVRKVRIDFAVRIESLTAGELSPPVLPSTLRPFVGTYEELRNPAANSKTHAALFWVHYPDAPARRSLLLLLKPRMTGDEPADVLHYHQAHPEFPQEPTADQVFDEVQWESYRKLGEHLATPLFQTPPDAVNWFWKIPLPPSAKEAP